MLSRGGLRLFSRLGGAGGGREEECEEEDNVDRGMSRPLAELVPSPSSPCRASNRQIARRTTGVRAAVVGSQETPRAPSVIQRSKRSFRCGASQRSERSNLELCRDRETDRSRHARRATRRPRGGPRAQGMRSVEPVVFRASRSWWAVAAPRRRYVWAMRTLRTPLVMAPKRSWARALSSSGFRT